MIAPSTGRRVWLLVLRAALGGIFVWAGLTKVLDPTGFLIAIYEYETGLPDSLVKLLAVTLPWIEVLSGLSIITGVWQETGLSVSGLSLCAFLVATGQAWVRGLEVSCGCFGTVAEGVLFLGTVQLAFLRNLLLLGIACVLLAQFAERRRALDAQLALAPQ